MKFCLWGRQHKSLLLTRELHAHPQVRAVGSLPRPPPASKEQPRSGALTTMIIFDIINIAIISTPHLVWRRDA